MVPVHLASRFSLTLAALAGLVTAAQGGFTGISQPNAAYLASTIAFDIPNGGAPPVQSLAAGDLTITFSAPMSPFGTATLYSGFGQQQSSRVLTFNEPVETFGLEMNPNLTTIFGPAPMTAKFFNGNTLLGTISQSVSQHSPKLFAATDTNTPFTSVQLSITGSTAQFGFMISDVRAAVPTPEPASLVLFGVGLFGVLGYGWRQRTGSREPRC